MPEFQLKTPVAFVIFNRPDTTERVFAEIAKAKPPKLLVVGDGPRAGREGEADMVAATRAIIDLVDWDCEVLTNYSKINLGCKRRVSSGIDWVFEQVEEAIILEDDVVPHPDFFPFCEFILEKYRDDKRVMMATGTNYLSNSNLKDPYFFSQMYTIWGWATWRRAWQLYDVTMTAWDSQEAKKDIQYKFNGSYIGTHFRETFDSLKTSYVDTWDIQWFFTCLYNSGLCATPRVNLITNIGVEGVHSSGVTDAHYLKTESLRLEEEFNPIFPVTVNSNYDFALHELKTRPALRKLKAIKILKKIGMFHTARTVYRRIRMILK